ncbi:MAG: polysaccharide biosynthesis/export family protein [Chitinispirillaceae bacterium]
MKANFECGEVAVRIFAPLFLFFFVVVATAQEQKTENEEKSSSQVAFRAGDAMKIQVFPDTMGFPNGLYFIDSDGHADLPVVGRIPVVGRSEEEITEFLKTEWAEYLRYPNVQIRPMVRINFLGGFFRPGLYCIDPRQSLWSAVYMTGGTVRSDGFKKMVWERGGEVIEKDLVTMLESGKSLYNLGFVTGDQIRVTGKPERDWWDVVRQDIFPTMTLLLSVATTSLTLYNNYNR